LLGLPVVHRRLKLGVVSDVLLGPGEGHVLGMLVASSWGGRARFLPVPAAAVGAHAVEASPLALLSERERAFYELPGARWAAAGPAARRTRGLEPSASG
jgi:hypothetical protein